MTGDARSFSVRGSEQSAARVRADKTAADRIASPVPLPFFLSADARGNFVSAGSLISMLTPKAVGSMPAVAGAAIVAMLKTR